MAPLAAAAGALPRFTEDQSPRPAHTDIPRGGLTPLRVVVLVSTSVVQYLARYVVGMAVQGHARGNNGTRWRYCCTFPLYVVWLRMITVIKHEQV